MMVFSPVLVLLAFATAWSAGLRYQAVVLLGVVALTLACAAHTREMMRRNDRRARHRSGRERTP